MAEPNLSVFNERDFIVQVLRAFVHGRKQNFSTPPDFDWLRLRSRLCSQSLGPIFNKVLRGLPPKEITNHWKVQQRNNFVMNARALKASVKLFNILERVGVATCAVRGIVLANLVYPSIELRKMQDIDILIRGEDKDRVAKAMAAEGFEPVKVLRSQLVYEVLGTVFEIHWSLLTSKRYGGKFISSELLRTRKEMDTEEGKIYRLSDEHELLALVAHCFVHHQLNRIFQLLDIALVIKKSSLDWDYLNLWVKQAKLSRMFFFLLSLINELFELSMGDALEVLGKDWSPNLPRLKQAYLNRLLARDSVGDYIWRKRNQLYVAEGLPLKLRQLIRFFSGDELRRLHKAFRSSRVTYISRSHIRSAARRNL